MFSGSSPTYIVWLIILGFTFSFLIIWSFYKLVSCLRNRQRDVESINEPESYIQISDKQTETKHLYVNEELPTIKSALQYANYNQDTFENPHNSSDQPETGEQISQPSRYLEGKGRGSNDRILGETLTKSIISGKSLTLRDIRSYGSRKSTGFEPSIPMKPDQTVQAIKGHKSGSFLEILNKLNAIEEDEDELEKVERERRKRRREQKARSQSLNGIEVNSSDETASQTFIGKSSEARPDPGRIRLSLIKAEDLTNW